MAGLSVGGFIAIVIFILILNVGGVIGYYKFMEKNPDKAVSVNLDAGLVPKIRYVGRRSLMFGNVLLWIYMAPHVLAVLVGLMIRFVSLITPTLLALSSQ